MKVLVLAANGMIGSAMFRVLSERDDWTVIGTTRTEVAQQLGNKAEMSPHNLMTGVELTSPDSLMRLFRSTAPDVVVNCAGLTKHVAAGNDPLMAISMNALLPHRLAALCEAGGTRLVHISTDCIFSGKTGNYSETDVPDADDLYGRTKYLGEVSGTGIVTLRTSAIGHELGTGRGLLEWFLAQSECKGYRRAVFSGLPTVVLAKVVRDLVIPNSGLSGLYHVGANAIDKYSLLCLIAKTYGRKTKIIPDEGVQIDRSLNIGRFRSATGFCAPEWPELIELMQSYH